MAQVIDLFLGIFWCIMSHSVVNMESDMLIYLVPIMYDPDWSGMRVGCYSFVCCIQVRWNGGGGGGVVAVLMGEQVGVFLVEGGAG